MFSDLKANWVVAWHNIITEKYVGESHGYTVEDTAIGTTNGAGPTNTQILMLAPDGTVLHALPGFWHAVDLAREMKLAKDLWTVWKDAKLTRAQKDARFAAMQIEAWKAQPAATTARSRWQGFDAKNEHKRVALGIARDTVQGAPVQRKLSDAEKAEIATKMAGMNTLDEKVRNVELKPINQLVHERMSVRPFVKYEAFDIADFTDYGRRYYDNNKKVDGEGSTLMTPRKVAKEEQKAERREQMQQRMESLKNRKRKS